MTIYFYKGLTRNPEIGNTPVRVLSDTWRLGQVRDAKFVMDVPNEMLLNAAKFHSYSVYYFWVIKRKTTGGKIANPPPRLGLKIYPPVKLKQLLVIFILNHVILLGHKNI